LVGFVVKFDASIFFIKKTCADGQQSKSQAKSYTDYTVSSLKTRTWWYQAGVVIFSSKRL